MTLICAIPIIVTPVRLGGASGEALAGHPSTRLAAVAVGGTGGLPPRILEPGAFGALLSQAADFTWCCPQERLVRRFLPTMPRLFRAEDMGRLAGRTLWSAEESDLIVPALTPQIRQRAQHLVSVLEKLVSLTKELLTPREMEAYATHRAINDRGLAVDVGLLSWLSAVIDRREQMRTQGLGEVLHRSHVTAAEILRPKGLLDRMLAYEGLTLRQRGEEDLLALEASGTCSPQLVEILNLLVGHGRIARAKVQRMRRSLGKDQRLREQFVSWAARTWRYSSHDTQVQNLPKPLRGIDFEALKQATPESRGPLVLTVEEKHLARLGEAVPGGQVEDAFVGLLRMTFAAPKGRSLIILDWNAIEPRIRAWLSGDHEHMAAWRHGRDLYCELISSIIGRPVTKASDPHLRTIGKLADIGCGYNMGADSFADLCSKNGVNLTEYGVTAEQVVHCYRVKYAALADRRGGLWHDLDEGARQAVRCGSWRVRHVEFSRTPEGHLDVLLPNGSRRRWWNARLEMRSPPWAKAGDHRQDREALVVSRTPEAKPDEVMYGGRILENLCQALGREILVDFLITVEREGFCPVAHCHDEAVMEVLAEEAFVRLQRARELAEVSPSWALTLPLKAEAFVAPFWAKEEVPGGRAGPAA